MHAATTPGDLAAARANGTATHIFFSSKIERLKDTPGGIQMQVHLGKIIPSC
jgi:hypothetical protein